MQRNSSQCAHCGKTFVRITEQTPLVNRSDGKRYHLTLFSGPDPRPKQPRGSYIDQVICNFAYAHDQFGPENHSVVVVIDQVLKNPEQVIRQIEEAADKLAALVEEGHRLTAVYTLKHWQLAPGFTT